MLVVVAAACGCGDPEHIPLSTVFTVVPNFPTTGKNKDFSKRRTIVPLKMKLFFLDFCNRTCYSKYWMAEGNVRHVSFTGTLNECEAPRKHTFNILHQMILSTPFFTFCSVNQLNCADVSTII